MQFKAGHQCYDPHYWLEHDEPYEVSVRNPCEPYVIALLDTLPHFDQRFRGRLRDKVFPQPLFLSLLPLLLLSSPFARAPGEQEYLSTDH